MWMALVSTALLVSLGVGANMVEADGDPEYVQACVNQAGGVSIVDSTEECKKHQTPIIWNVEGPQGDPGLACWDLDGDGEGDIDEDVNDDGNYDALDCQGPQGPPGPVFAGALVNSYRVQVFGHAGHTLFSTDSTSYVPVPGTFPAQISRFPAPASGTSRVYRVEVSFAVDWDRIIRLRLRDPWNERTKWEFSFQGGHAPNSWWSWNTTPRFTVEWPDAWPRQHQLEMKNSDNTVAHLGSVWIVAEDIIP
jgi:hypothetical protein